MYMRYRVASSTPDGCVVCPPVVDGWRQLCAYLGAPGLAEGESDFVYGGSAEQSRAMRDVARAYFRGLADAGVVHDFALGLFALEEAEGDLPVGG